MKDLIDSMSGNRIHGSEGGLLSRYLDYEDICGLNNPEVLEEVLKNVENSIVPKERYTSILYNTLLSKASVLLSYFKGFIGVFERSAHRISNYVSGLFLHGRFLLRIRILTVMPVFFIVLSLFTPSNSINEPEIINLPQCLEAGFTKPASTENTAAYRSNIYSKDPKNSLLYSTSSKIREIRINQALSYSKSAGNKEKSDSISLSAVIDSKPSSKAPGEKSNRTGQLDSTGDKSAAVHQNSISRADKERADIPDVVKNFKKKLVLKATAYDLSVRSCQKPPSHPAYGITKSGTRATVGRTIAVDPSIIPLKSKVYISFPEAYKHMNGIYYAEDTGSLIKGNKIDIFLGEDKPGQKSVFNQAKKFGIQTVEVYIL